MNSSDRVQQLAAEIDGLFWHRQPIVSLPSLKVVMYELLARHIKGGVTVSAWPLIEEISQHDNLSRLLDQRTLTFALGLLKVPGNRDRYAVNISGATINNPQFVGKLIQQIKDAQIDPSLLVFEIVEHSPLLDKYAAGNLLALQESKVLISLDDTGLGFNSLSRLRDHRYDFIKIEGSFIRKLSDRNTDNHAIVEGLLTIAVKARIPIVCESVESALIEKELLAIVQGNPDNPQLEKLLSGYLYGQGWHYFPQKDEPC